MRYNVAHEVGRALSSLGFLALAACQPPVGAGPVAGAPQPAPRVEEEPVAPPKPARPAAPPEAEPTAGARPYERVPSAEVPRLMGALASERSDLVEALDRSLAWFAKPSSHESFPLGGISHTHAWASVAAFRELAAGVRDPQQLEQRIRDEFDFFQSLGRDGRGTVLFTGYYAPVFEGARARDDLYRYPLYRLPSDLVVDPVSGEVQGRGIGGRVVPYPTRAEIEESEMLKGDELVWLGDAFQAYLIHVQGSASVRLRDGSIMRVGYAGNNGHDYVSVSRELLADGKLAEDEISLDEVRGYFAAHPADLQPYLRRNPRFIFFGEVDASDWPTGSLGIRVMPLRSLAADKQLFPPGGVVFVVTQGPDRDGRIRWFEQFMLDQDSGGAIRSPGRADIYYGVGPEAERRAGGQYADGRLYYLFLKPERLDYWRNQLSRADRPPGSR
jgi:membrane-bound lytic murein transglycosylase A